MHCGEGGRNTLSLVSISMVQEAAAATRSDPCVWAEVGRGSRVRVEVQLHPQARVIPGHWTPGEA